MIWQSVNRARRASFLLEWLDSRLLLSTLDTLVFGDSASETSHSVLSNSTQVIAGNLGQPARQELPLNPLAINGGDMTFTMAVDPVRRNYFSLNGIRQRKRRPSFSRQAFPPTEIIARRSAPIP